MTDTLNKVRTSISIDPGLLEVAKDYCKGSSELTGTKLSLSKLVTKALKNYIPDDKKVTEPVVTGKSFNEWRAHV
jgi:hypothetical protein